MHLCFYTRTQKLCNVKVKCIHSVPYFKQRHTLDILGARTCDMVSIRKTGGMYERDMPFKISTLCPHKISWTFSVLNNIVRYPWHRYWSSTSVKTYEE